MTTKINAVQVAFKTKRGDKNILPSYPYIRCHMLFDVKMEDFCRKEIYVTQGNMTEVPAKNNIG